MIEQILRIVSPASRLGFWFKSLVLVSTYTAFDQFVRGALSDQMLLSSHANLMTTFGIGAPFALFAMWIMARQRALKEQLNILARTDPLTGLSNRACFMESADRMLEAGGETAILMIDLDHFKSVNDTYGHSTGDLTLQRTARHLRLMARRTDIIGRVGGEEFLILLPNTSQQDAEMLAERICQPISIRVKNLTNDTPVDVRVTMSIGGTAFHPADGLATFLHRAHEAMYQAKKQGRNQVVFNSRAEAATPVCHPKRMSA